MAAPAETYRWPCDQCGADLSFAPGQTELVCGHCGHVQRITASPEPDRKQALGELDLHAALRNALPDRAMVTVRTTSCPSCGAQVEFDGTTHATRCPFCASPVVVDTGSQRQIKPQAVVPFVLTEAQARASMTDWLGGLWFAPNGLQEYARKGRSLSGIYVPYWTFDAATRSRYSGQRGDAYYETRTVTVQVNGRNEQRQEQVRKIRWSRASGTVARVFDDVLVMAATSLPRGHADGLEPWDLSALVPYRPDYLAGFQAEGYTVALDAGHGIARDKMAVVIDQDVRRDIGGDEQRVDSINTDFSRETFKHILLPVWMAAYKYSGKSYRFIVNGQTGKVQGERPYSVWKIAFAVLVAAVAIGVVAYFSQQGR